MYSDIVREKIDKEIKEGRVAGPFERPPFEKFRLSPLGVIPKKEPGSYRLIHHLSYPNHHSLNDQFYGNLCSVSYTSFDEAINKLQKLGWAAQLAKADIKSAFRLLPIHPDGFNSLGFQFEGKYFFDKCLPMGCSVSCFYFESFSSFVEWVVAKEAQSSNVLHYLDDFLFLGPADSDECKNALYTFFDVCRCFGIPLAQEKTVFPATSSEFLGITIDTIRMEFRLPQEKIVKTCTLLSEILGQKEVSLKLMQNLLGLLAFASRVVPMGRVFSRKLYLAISGFENPQSLITITPDMKRDLIVWKSFFIKF